MAKWGGKSETGSGLVHSGDFGIIRFGDADTKAAFKQWAEVEGNTDAKVWHNNSRAERLRNKKLARIKMVLKEAGAQDIQVSKSRAETTGEVWIGTERVAKVDGNGIATLRGMAKQDETAIDAKVRRAQATDSLSD